MPVIELKVILGSSFFDLLTMPLSAVAETYIVKHKESEILLARSAQECEQSIESAKKFLTGTGINRTALVALDGLSTAQINDVSRALALIGANAVFMRGHADGLVKKEMLKKLGADTLIVGSRAVTDYIAEKNTGYIDSLFRVIMVSGDFQDYTEVGLSALEEKMGAPVYQVISLPWTTMLLDSYRDVRNKIVTREGLFIERDKNGIIITDTDSRTIPLIGVKL